VKGQSSAFLEKSRELLTDAEAIYSINRHEAAACTTYMAGFHAVQALIFEDSGRIYKTHGGVSGEFARLVKDTTRAWTIKSGLSSAALTISKRSPIITPAPVPTSRLTWRARPSTARAISLTGSPPSSRCSKPTSVLPNGLATTPHATPTSDLKRIPSATTTSNTSHKRRQPPIRPPMLQKV
jgi:hypothetical protein